MVAYVLLAAILVAKSLTYCRTVPPERVIANDVISYYAYLPATFIEHDPSLQFTDREHKGTYWPEVLPDGTKVIKTTMGMSLMYLPFFMAAHVAAPFAGYEASGFTAPYAAALLIASLCYVLAGLWLLRKLLARHFSEPVAAAVLLIIGLCTNLYWYTIYEGPMSHGYSFALICLLAYLTEKWYCKPTAGTSFAVGLTLGLISLIRPTNCIVALYFLLYGISGKGDLGARWQLYRSHLAKLLIIAASILAVWAPQMAYWHSLTGNLFFYSYSSNEHFFFSAPKILPGLFGFRKGWLIYTPAMVFALVGLIPLFRSHRQYFLAITIYIGLHMYITFSWWCWWYGGSLGLRAMIDTYGLLAFPLAALLQWVSKRPFALRVPLGCAVLAVSLLSGFHNLQYYNGAIHWDSMTRASYCDSFLHRHPSERFESLLEAPDYTAAKNGHR